MTTDLKQFAAQLLAGTKAGRVKWKADPTDEGAFFAEARAGALRVRQEERPSGAVLTTLTVIDPEGQEAANLATDPDRPGPWRDWEETLMDLWEDAHMVGSGTADVLEGLAKEWELPPGPAQTGDDDIPF